MINQETIDKIKQLTDPVSVISQFVKLSRKGMSYRGLCPFHKESNPSFSVLPGKGIYKCFSCGETGDVINFLMKHETMTFEEVIRWLAVQAGVSIEDSAWTREEKSRHVARESFFALNEVAAEHFVNCLKTTEAQFFLNQRDINSETALRFSLGFAPRTEDLLVRTLTRRGYPTKMLADNGLVFKSPSRSDLIDRFRNRLIFPIRNLSGRIVAFGGRIIFNHSNVAKYHNSPESMYYHKRKELYGLFEGKCAIAKADNCFVVEGYTDVLRLSAGGVEEVVSPLGTALTLDQAKLLKRFTCCVTIMTDGDNAGHKSAHAMLKLFLTEGFDVYIVPLPQDEDPDSYCKKIPKEELRMRLYAARQDALEYFAAMIWEKSGKETLRKSKALQEITELLACVGNSVQSYLYREKIAALTGFFDARILNPNLYSINLSEKKQLDKKILSTREKYERRLISWLIKRGEERFSVVLENNEIWQPNVLEFVGSVIGMEGIQWQFPLYKCIWEELSVMQVPPEIGYELYYLHHKDEEVAEEARSIIYPDTDDIVTELRSILISLRLSDIQGAISKAYTKFHSPDGKDDCESTKMLIISLKEEWCALRGAVLEL